MIERVVKMVLDMKPQGSVGAKGAISAARGGQAEGGIGDMVRSLLNLGGGTGAVAAVTVAHQKYMEVLNKLGPGGSLLKMATGGLMGFIEGIKDFINKWIPLFNELGKAASPAMAKEQERAWKDLYAVLGRLFLPVTRAVTDAIRLLADVIHTVIPDSQTMARHINNVGAAFKVLRGIMSSLIPGGLTSSVGASGVGSQYTSGQDFAKQQNISALSATGATKAPERTAIATEKILSFLVSTLPGAQALKAARGIAGMLNG